MLTRSTDNVNPSVGCWRIVEKLVLAQGQAFLLTPVLPHPLLLSCEETGVPHSLAGKGARVSGGPTHSAIANTLAEPLTIVFAYCYNNRGLSRGVAQFGSAHGSGP
jgi:hypothetical protein